MLRPGGRIVAVGMSKDTEHDPLIGVLEWTHKHFPNFLDCRPIYVRNALEKAGFKIQKVLKKHTPQLPKEKKKPIPVMPPSPATHRNYSSRLDRLEHRAVKEKYVGDASA